MKEEHGRIILSSWIRGEHLDDVKLIPVKSFPTPLDAIAKDVRGGHDLEDLIKRHGPRLIADLIADYYPTIYRTIMMTLLKGEMMRTIPTDASPSELKTHAEKFERYWSEPIKPMDVAVDYWDELAERKKRETVHTGIAILDRKTDGVRPGGLTIVGARPSVGKSAFALQVAVNVAKKGKKVLFLPLEMTASEIIDRIVLRFGKGIEARSVRTGKMTSEEQSAVSEVIEQVYQMRDRFKIYEGARQMSQIRSLIEDEEPDLIVIDQLSQIRTDDDSQTIRERYVEITRSLKAIALETKTAVWLPVQMNRESSKTGATTIDYLKESGSIEEDADVVLILSNEKDEQGRNAMTEAGRVVKIELAKNRQGETGEDLLEFIGPRFTFRNLETMDGFIPSEEDVPF